MTKRVLFTPPAYVLCGKVMFLIVSVYLLTGGPHVIGHVGPLDLPPPMALVPSTTTWEPLQSQPPTPTTWNPLLDMLKLIVKCFIALRLKGLLVTAHQ